MKLSRLIQLFLTAVLANTAAGQEMEPRAYSPAPSGMQFVLLSYGHQTGDVLLDSSLPLKDVNVSLNAASFGYGRTFNFLGRQANVAVLVPYIWGTAHGTVFENQINVRRSGGGDLRVRFSTLFKGGEALAPKEFSQRKPVTIIGASVSIVVPTGQYDPVRLVNPGSNRWAFKPEIGISRTLHSWMLELDLGSWLFIQNSNFFQGQVREQAPIGSAQAHLSYTFRPGLWVALDGTYYTGGRTHINGVRSNDLQQNSRLGSTLALPLTRSQSLKLAYNRGATVRVGGNFTTFGITYQLRWFTRR